MIADVGGLAAAEARADAWFAAFDRLDVEAFGMTALPSADHPDRVAARERVDRLADDHALGGLVTEARATARAAVLRRYDDGGFRPTMLGLNWGVSEGTARDRVAAAIAAEDAVAAAIVEPYLDEATLAALASPFELIDRGRGVRTEFDLTRATADRLHGRRGMPWLAWLVVAIGIAGALSITLVVGSVWLAALLVVGTLVLIGFIVRSGGRERP
jgi:hypothetical protein